MSCGCRNSIHKGLGELNGVFGVRVEPQYDRIVIDHTDEVSRAELLARLEKSRYGLRFMVITSCKIYLIKYGLRSDQAGEEGPAAGRRRSKRHTASAKEQKAATSMAAPV